MRMCNQIWEWKDNGFGCGDSNTDCGGIVVFLAHGAAYRNMGRHHADQWQDASVFGFVRPGDRRIVYAISMPFRKGISKRLCLLISPVPYCLFCWHSFDCFFADCVS